MIKPANRRTSAGSARWRTVGWILSLSVVAGVVAAIMVRRPPGHPSVPVPAGPVTFHRDIAPIIYNHCAPCHHPGEAAPFDLLSYADVRKRVRQVADVTQRRIMPPWLPERGPFPLEGDRSLEPHQIELIQRWAAQGAPEGLESEAPPRPVWKDGWQLGTPDLVVTMPEAYTVPAEGEDVYRNFVLPIRNADRRLVRAIELAPGNSRVVHHAFMLLDPTRGSRRSDEAEAGPGFDGLHTPRSAQPPEGHFLSWQPGKRPSAEAGGSAWTLERDSDLLLQMHLRPSGRPERLQASVALYFTNRPPARTPFKVGMKSFTIDIPAGAEAHWVRDEMTLPVDVDVLSILPHAHYLARELHAVAAVPGGRELPLLTIPRWDFNWQGDYIYRQPVFLPKGSIVSMRYRYDNSTNNPVNPNSPPRAVKYGLRSIDEMAELWLLVLPRDPSDLRALVESYRPRVLSEAELYSRYLLGLNPNDPWALIEIGKVHFARNKVAEAQDYFQRAAGFGPDLDESHYFLGLVHRVKKDLEAARSAFRKAIEINPQNAKAHGNLGLVAVELGAPDEAIVHFQEALRLNPDDEIARSNLGRLAAPDSKQDNGRRP